MALPAAVVRARNVWLRLASSSSASAEVFRHAHSTSERIHGDRPPRESDSDRGRRSALLLGAAVGVAAGAFFANFRDRLPSFVPEVSAAQKFGDSNDGEVRRGDKKLRQTFNFIADVVQDVAPSLVYIEIVDLGVRNFYTGEPLTRSNGSGFVVGEDGLILTNAHVVANKPHSAVQVRLHDGRKFTGVVEDLDMRSDLATIRIPCKNLPAMPLGQSSNIRPGEFVIALGSPLTLSNTVTTGVVSTANRQKTELGLRDRDVPEYIQTDAAITFGNSGGPLVNLDGEAIGINSMKVTAGISFAIPIDYAKDFLRRCSDAREKKSTSSWFGSSSETRAPQRRYIGVEVLSLTHQTEGELRQRLGLPLDVKHGVAVFRIVPGSPANVAGVQYGDLITNINGVEIHSSRDINKLLESDCDKLVMNVVRRRQRINIVVTPEAIQDDV